MLILRLFPRLFSFSIQLWRSPAAAGKVTAGRVESSGVVDASMFLVVIKLFVHI